MIDPRSGLPLHRQVADDLRRRILSGEFPAGSKLRSHEHLRQEYDVGRGTMRQAIATLRAEGLLEVEQGYGTRVRRPAEVEELPGESGELVRARMPTPAERSEYQMAEGVPVIVVHHPDGLQDAYPADEYGVRIRRCRTCGK